MVVIKTKNFYSFKLINIFMQINKKMFNHKIIFIIGIVFFLIFSSYFNSVHAITKQQNRCIIVLNSDDLDEKIKGFMELGHFPSLVTCIVKNNTLAWSKAYGNSKIGFLFNKEVTTDTVFAMASISKSVAATAIMKLNESGLIGLDDNVSRYLPFDLKNPRYPEINITPRMLLAHQSSIDNPGLFITLFHEFLENPLNHLEQYFKKEKSWKDYAPGENVTYTTIDINLLGFVLENITGQTYSDFCKENIFEPLEMKNTSYFLDDFKRSQLVKQYVWFNGFYLPVPFIKISKMMFPGGGVRSTVNDMSHFLIMHANGGVYNGTRILNESSVEEMHRAQYPDSLDEGYNHGLGWYFKEFPDGEIYGGHSGNHLGSFAVMKMRYSDKTGVIYFFNQHSYILMNLNKTPENEIDAVNGIREALFEKADEL